jgi:hypothetical protein
VLATGVASNLIDHGADTVNVGNSGSVQGILGALSISNPTAYSRINVDDSADTTARTATLNQSTINGSPYWETLGGLAPAAINYYDFDVWNVAVLTNSHTSLGGPE